MVPRSGLAVSPDGRRLAWSDCRTREEIDLLVTTASGALRPVPISGGAWVDRTPGGIPGSDRLLVVSDRSGRSQVWEIDPEGGQPARALPGSPADVSYISVSPDGRQLALQLDGVWVMPRDGSAPPRQVAARGSYASFAFDGALVYAVPDDAGVPRLVRRVGDREVPLAGPAEEAVASPVEDIVIYAALEPGVEIGRLTVLDGRGRRTPIPGLPTGYYFGLRLSADGRRLLALREGHELIEVDWRTGRVLRAYSAGADQLSGAAYRGDDIAVWRVSWTGDLWLAEGVQ
jgi:dipeptidyl aminopeptidase/acylaminoacyl peptidase